MLAQRLRQFLPRRQTKAKVREEPRLACTITMRRIEQVIRDLLALDHQLVWIG